MPRVTSGWRLSTRPSGISWAGLTGTGFELLPCTGTYFQTVRFTGRSRCARHRLRPVADPRGGRAAIPVGLLRRRARRAGDPLLLCQARRDAGGGFRAAPALLLNSAAYRWSLDVRNILLFILFLIGLTTCGVPCVGRCASPRPPGGMTRRPQRGAPVAEIEQMVACAHCGLHVPESEGRAGWGRFLLLRGASPPRPARLTAPVKRELPPAGCRPGRRFQPRRAAALSQPVSPDPRRAVLVAGRR